MCTGSNPASGWCGRRPGVAAGGFQLICTTVPGPPEALDFLGIFEGPKQPDARRSTHTDLRTFFSLLSPPLSPPFSHQQLQHLQGQPAQKAHCRNHHHVQVLLSSQQTRSYAQPCVRGLWACAVMGVFEARVCARPNEHSVLPALRLGLGRRRRRRRGRRRQH